MPRGRRRKRAEAEAEAGADGEGAGAAAAVEASTAAAAEAKARVRAFRRGAPVATRRVQDRRLQGRLRHGERLADRAARDAARASQWLQLEEAGAVEPEGPMEQTWRFRQEALAAAAEEAGGDLSAKRLELGLGELGPYRLDFTREGRFLLYAGRKGHLAMMDWQRRKPVCEVQVRELVRDACFLHNGVFFAAAQKQYTYIYDKRGLEIHCLKEHAQANRLEFLKHHFLLCSVGKHGVLTYQDTSTGQIVAQQRTKLGPCDALRQNPHNGVMCLGHGNGTVAMWSPNLTAPLVKMLCHRGPLRALAVDDAGRHLVTAGADGQVKVWDVRTYKLLHAYFASAPPVHLDISQRGLLAVGWGRRVQVWKDALARKAKAPYLNHSFEGGHLQDFHFCPYEDVLIAGHSGGLSSMLVPGAGEPNYDSFVANPFQTRKERREAEVHMLLEKLQPETIVLDPSSIGQVRRLTSEAAAEKRAEQQAANAAARDRGRRKNAEKTKMKGKNKASKRHRKKQLNVIVDKSDKVAKELKEAGQRRAEKAAREARVPAGTPKALERFY